MMKHMKKALALLLAFCMVLGSFSAAYAVPDAGENKEAVLDIETVGTDLDAVNTAETETGLETDKAAEKEIGLETDKAAEMENDLDETIIAEDNENLTLNIEDDPVMLADDTAIKTVVKEQSVSLSDSTFYRIFHLDAGRKYFSVSQIKAIIDELADYHYTHLELALGNDALRFVLDDMSVEANGTTYSSSSVTTGIQNGNKAYYDDGNGNYLTQSEMDEILSYAKQKHISIIPLINTPGHMDSIVDAMEYVGISSPAYNNSARTVDVTNGEAVNFTLALVEKYIEYFAEKGCEIFNMGCDEYANDKYTTGSMGFGALINNGHYDEFIDYVNTMAAQVQNAGMVAMAFNDGIYYNNNKSNGTFDTNIAVAYWTSGWTGYTVRSAANLAGDGFKIINTNDKWYYVLGRSSGTYGLSNAKSNVASTSVTSVSGSSSVTPAGCMACVWCDTPSVSYSSSEVSNLTYLIKTLSESNDEYFVAENPEPEEPVIKNQVQVNLKVGETSDIFMETSGVYTEGAGLDTGIASVSLSPASTSYTVTTNGITEITSGKKYLIVNRGAAKTLTNETGTTSNENAALKLDGSISATDGKGSEIWTITEANGGYYVQDESGKYMDIVDGAVVLSESSAVLDVTYSSSYGWQIAKTGEVTDNSRNSNSVSYSDRNNSKYKNGSYYVSVNGEYKAVTGLSCSITGNFLNYSYKWTISYDGGSVSATSSSVTLYTAVTYYLNNFEGAGAYAFGYTAGASSDSGSRWDIYSVELEEKMDATAVQFTGVAIGTTSCVIGETQYDISVSATSAYRSTHSFVIDMGLPLSITAKDLGVGDNWNDIYVDGALYGNIEYSLTNGLELIYTPTSVLKGTDEVILLLFGDNGYEQHWIYINPATTVYYEEGFADAEGFKGGTKGSGMQTAQLAGASTDNYGYDAAYADNQGKSSGSSYVSQNSKDKMTFDFTGTGIDVYANCSKETGYANIYVYKVEEDGSQTIVKLAIVDTNSKSEIYGISESEEYDLPILSMNGLEYGNYQVKIVARGKVDIDGFRVYETLDPEEALEPFDYYMEDEEDCPVFVELRDQALSYDASPDTDIDIDDSDAEAAEPGYHQVFENISMNGDLDSAIILDGNDQIDASTLLNDGPKNELFLAPHQALVFSLTTDRKVEVGLKAVNGETTYTINGGNGTSVREEIKSTTDMFYTAAEKGDEETQAITIANTGNHYLSVTKVKICDDPNVSLGQLTEEDIKNAYAVLGLIDEKEVVYADAVEKVQLVDYKGTVIASSELTINGESGQEALFAAEDILAAAKAILPSGYAIADVKATKDMRVVYGESGIVSVLAGKTATLNITFRKGFKTVGTKTLTSVQTSSASKYTFTSNDIKAAAPAGYKVVSLTGTSVKYGASKSISATCY